LVLLGSGGIWQSANWEEYLRGNGFETV
jgi:hypothetical protein